MPDIVVATIPKPNGREEIRVTLNEYRGRSLVSLRVWYRDAAGEMKPGRSGVNVAVDMLPALVDGLGLAVGEARSCGLLA